MFSVWIDAFKFTNAQVANVVKSTVLLAYAVNERKQR